MRVRTYAPLPSWPPALLAGAILTAAYVVGPLIARVLNAVDNNLIEFDSPDPTYRSN